MTMKNKQTIIATLGIETDEGNFVARYSSAGLARLDFPTATSGDVNSLAPRSGERVRERGLSHPKAAESISAAAPAAPQVTRWHKLTTRAVRQALQGRPIAAQPPVDLSSGTAFQRKVWAALQAIPTGKTETYADLAASLKKPKAARAVGGACGANPVPLLIPCHRVVAAQGGLGGFSGGLHWKRKLLDREGATSKAK